MDEPHDRPLVPDQRSMLRSALLAAGYIGLYVLFDLLSQVQPLLKLGITPWSPHAGLTLALLLTRGPQWVPCTVVAAFLAEVIERGGFAMPAALLSASVWIAAGYGGLAAILKRFEMPVPIQSLAIAARFVLTALITTFVIAAGYVAIFAFARLLPHDMMDEGVTRYWIGDLNGVLTLTPLLLYAHRWRDARRVIFEHRWLVLAQVGAVLLTCVVFLEFVETDRLRMFYPLFVPVIWVALRWGVPGAILSVLAIQIGLILGMQDDRPTAPLLDLQFLMLTLNSTALLLGAAITERSDALHRAAMREAEQRALFETAPDAVLTVDLSGRIRSANSAALRLFGDAAGPQSGAVLNDLLPAISLNTSEGRAAVEGRRADGSTFPAEAAWARLDVPVNEGFLVIVRDATERRSAEEKLRERDTALARAMRFAVAGELASALAHELNQPITALVSYLRASEILAKPFGAQDERLGATLGKAVQEAIRASEVLRRLRDFYQGGAINREPVQVVSVCGAVANAFQERMRRSRVRFDLRLPAHLPTVEIGSTQLEIVLHNLLSNAIDAVSQANVPERRIELSGEYTEKAVVLRVEDSGGGIVADVKQKLFEPFVTSKVDGMGLGLAISKSLLRGQAAELVFEPSARLGGACFTVHLPRHHPKTVA